MQILILSFLSFYMKISSFVISIKRIKMTNNHSSTYESRLILSSLFELHFLVFFTIDNKSS